VLELLPNLNHLIPAAGPRPMDLLKRKGKVRQRASAHRGTERSDAPRSWDDHVKNIAFLMDKSGQWSLSPAFDLTYSFNPSGLWTASHQMTLNGKRDAFTIEDFKACAHTASMKRGRAEAIVAEVLAVVSRWQVYARDAGVLVAWQEQIGQTLRLGGF